MGTSVSMVIPSSGFGHRAGKRPSRAPRSLPARRTAPSRVASRRNASGRDALRVKKPPRARFPCISLSLSISSRLRRPWNGCAKRRDEGRAVARMKRETNSIFRRRKDTGTRRVLTRANDKVSPDKREFDLIDAAVWSAKMNK